MSRFSSLPPGGSNSCCCRHVGFETVAVQLPLVTLLRCSEADRHSWQLDWRAGGLGADVFGIGPARKAVITTTAL